MEAVMQLPATASLAAVERAVIEIIRKACRAFNNKRPEVICIAYEHDPRVAHTAEVAEKREGVSRSQVRAGEEGNAAGNVAMLTKDADCCLNLYDPAEPHGTLRIWFDMFLFHMIHRDLAGMAMAEASQPSSPTGMALHQRRLENRRTCATERRGSAAGAAVEVDAVVGVAQARRTAAHRPRLLKGAHRHLSRLPARLESCHRRFWSGESARILGNGPALKMTRTTGDSLVAAEAGGKGGGRASGPPCAPLLSGFLGFVLYVTL